MKKFVLAGIGMLVAVSTAEAFPAASVTAPSVSVPVVQAAVIIKKTVRRRPMVARRRTVIKVR